MNVRFVRNGLRVAPLVAVLLLALGAPPASAAEFWLRAESFVKTLPDGRAVTMWGYAPCTGVNTGCGPATVPGPALTVPAGEALTINLYNNGLPEGVSVTIPGQPAPTDGVLPVQVVRNPDGRIRAFAHEVAAGASRDYVWPAGAIKPGSYLYQSASHPAVQVQMGLYGALESDAAAGNVYGVPETAYAADVTLLYSEIDPSLHDAVAAGEYGPGRAMTSTIDYRPEYFLVNGEPFAPGMSPTALGTPGQAVLLRLLNAGLKTRLPAFSGFTLSLVAEDGNRSAFPRQGRQAELYAGKTLDAIVTVPAAGYYPVFDRAQGLTNGATPGGGMLSYLQVADAAQFTLSVAKIGGGTGTVQSASAPGGIFCGGDCAETYNAGTAVRLTAVADPGSFFFGWSGACSGVGDCEISLGGGRNAIAEFRRASRVRVLAPNGREVFPEGSFTTIRWSAPASARIFTVQYSTNGGASWRLIERGVTGNSLVWEVPEVRSNRNRCRVRVRAYDGANRYVGGDRSNADFRILNVPVAASR